MDITSWFAVRCIFRHRGLQPDDQGFVYEERIVLTLATSLDEAISKAEQEAGSHASDSAEYLEFAQAYELPTDTLNDGTEVFSLMRSSKLEPSAYIDHFFDTGSEHSR
jgi:hypothetical protein